MDERRKYKRRNLALFTRVFDAASGDLLGNLADITTKGLMLITEQPICIDEVFQLQIDLSDAVFNRKSLEIKAKSVWCVPDLDPKHWNTGFQIMDLTDEDEKVIERINDVYGLRD